jgi:hypothetical protein
MGSSIQTADDNSPMRRNLVIGLPGWTIADGNYPNFACGDTAAFALEFYAAEGLEELERDTAPAPSLTNIADCHYEMVGQCVHRDIDGGQSWWAIDAGILLYRNERLPETARPGSWWHGKVYVGVDPFFYMERGSRHHEAPALIYDWRIDKIQIETGPFIEAAPNLMQRDPASLGWRDVGRTGSAGNTPEQYLLHCTRLEGPPRR